MNLLIRRISLLAASFALAYLTVFMLTLNGIRLWSRDFCVIIGSSFLATFLAMLAVRPAKKQKT